MRPLLGWSYWLLLPPRLAQQIDKQSDADPDKISEKGSEVCVIRLVLAGGLFRTHGFSLGLGLSAGLKMSGAGGYC